jgi:hypothetical protein
LVNGFTVNLKVVMESWLGERARLAAARMPVARRRAVRKRQGWKQVWRAAVFRHQRRAMGRAVFSWFLFCRFFSFG